MVCVSLGAELPEVYKPYEKLLGTWEGEGVMTVTVKGAVSKLALKSKITYAYDEERQAMTGKEEYEYGEGDELREVTIHSEGRWDEQTQSFRSLMWVPGKMAKQGVTLFIDGELSTRGVGEDRISKWLSSVALLENGKARMKGTHIVLGDHGVIMEWDYELKKVK